jgi:hypothetical protein
LPSAMVLRPYGPCCAFALAIKLGGLLIGREILIITLVLALFFPQVVCGKKRFPKVDHRPRPNPLKGFYTEVETYYPKTNLPQNLAYANWTWRQLEPDGPSRIDWRSLEASWRPHLKLGRRIAIRISMADPNSPHQVDIPLWLLKKGVILRTYSIDGKRGKLPDWDSEILIKNHERLLGLVGKRYDGDPRIAWVDIGSYGIWGEWHVHENEALAGSNLSKLSYFQHYLNFFHKTLLVLPFDDPFMLQQALKHGVGVRNDCLGRVRENNWFTRRFSELEKDMRESHYKRAMFNGEFCGGMSGANFSLTHRYETTREFLKENHWINIGPAGGHLVMANGTLLKRAVEIYRQLGYRFHLQYVRIPQYLAAGEDLKVGFRIVNTGVTPFYWNWVSEIVLVAAGGKKILRTKMTGKKWETRTWLPGSRYLKTELPLAKLKLPEGRYKLYWQIRNPANEEEVLNLAVKRRHPKWGYYLGRFDLSS